MDVKVPASGGKPGVPAGLAALQPAVPFGCPGGLGFGRHARCDFSNGRAFSIPGGSMIDLKCILCPVDFSEASRHAMAHAAAVAKWYGSRLVALHVIHPSVILEPPILLADFPRSGSPTDLDRQRLWDELSGWLEEAASSGTRTKAYLDKGDPSQRILERAATLPADLIVLGTHGRSGVERFILGSVAEKVLRKAACPVLTVPPPSLMKARLPYTRILCPVDFSESSLSALQFAASIAKESDARLTILHVLESAGDTELLVEDLGPREFRDVIEARARTSLESLVTDDLRTWCHPETQLAYGKPYRQILDAADKEASDLIVMGVRGRYALDLAMFGSTTNHVVRRATCSVLTLKS